MPNSTDNKPLAAPKAPAPKPKSGGKKKGKKVRKPGRYSYIFSVLFMLFGVALIVGFFKREGIIVEYLCGFFSGIFGLGMYVVPFAMFLDAYVLLFSKKRTAVFRAFCVMLVPFFIGVMFHLFKNPALSEGVELWRELWDTGKLIVSGGVLSGGFARVLVKLFGRITAWFIVIVLFLLTGIISLGIPFIVFLSKPAGKQKKREKRENFYDDFKTEIVRGDDVYANEPKKPVSYVPRQVPRDEDAIRRQIDMPLDDVQPKKKLKIPIEGIKGFFNKQSNVLKPHEYLEDELDEGREKIAPEDIAKAVSENPIPGFPEEADTFVPAPEPIPLDTEIKPTGKTKSESDDAAEKSFEDEVIAAQSENTPAEKYEFPPMDLLTAVPTGKPVDNKSEISVNQQRLESALYSFGINADISNIVRGPSVTRYEMELEVGVKLNKLTSLSVDIALALGVTNVRIAAIPNKVRTVGIEVPNKSINTVYLREIIDSEAFRASESKLTFSIGKSISGEAVVGNIAKLPHLLIAGTTGSGKSVCLNSLILSILYKATPDEVKFIMIDPKMVEFNVYNGIPHLLVPVVTEAKKASGALQWAVVEMMKRYRVFSETGARDITSYNDLASYSDTDDIEPMPQIVVIIDELADLMLVAAKEVEESVCRIAQMGRAAGIHLVIATQSPRADVITGLMKANIPSRISFKVASALESRIILDAGGNADKLLGNGDLLYAPVGMSRPARIQGAWVTDKEREEIVNFVKNNGNAHYSETIISEIEKAAEDKKSSAQADKTAEKIEESDTDILFPQAVDVVLEMNQASVSMLQRRLKLGYSRAARLVDQMEEKGIVGPFEGSKPRQVLITKQQWQEMQLVQGTAPITPNTDPMQTMETADDLFDEE